MIIILFGQDTFRSRARLRTLIDAFKKKFDPNGYNTSRFVGPKIPFEEVQSAFGTVSFLGTRRCMVIEDFFAAKIPEEQKKIAAYFLERDTDDHVILFWQAGNVPAAWSRSALMKAAKKESFDFLQGNELVKWIRQRAAERSISVSPQAVNELVERVGSDLWALANTLDQLASFVSARPSTEITPKDVALFTEAGTDDNIFHLTDALGSRNASRALELLYDQLQNGSHPLYILTMLVKQFRLLVQLADMSTQHTPQSLGVHPFVYQKALGFARKFPIPKRIELFGLLQQIDEEVKTTGADAETLLVRFVVRSGQ